MQEILLKIRFFERGLSKSLEKSTLFFLPNPVPFSGQSYKKQKGSAASDQSLFSLRHKFKKTLLLNYVYYMTKFDNVI